MSTQANPGVAVAGGRPNYSGNYIPEAWSLKLIDNFYDETVLKVVCNTDYEGEIAKQGDRVNIRTRANITVRNYTRQQAIKVENPDSPKIQLIIDKAKYFACIEDEIDKMQTDINLVDEWAEDAGHQMKIAIDTDVLQNIIVDVHAFNRGNTAGRKSKMFTLGTDAVPINIDVGGVGNGFSGANELTTLGANKRNKDIIRHITEMATVLDEANVPQQGRYLIMPPVLCNLIFNSKLGEVYVSGDDTSMLRTGKVGMVGGFDVYKSQLLKTDNTSAGFPVFSIIAGIKMACAFASQIAKTNMMPHPDAFGDLIRGLQVYGYKAVKTEAFLVSVVRPVLYQPST